MANNQHYIFIDESGDPGKPFETDTTGNEIPTGASLFYILTAIYLDSVKLFALENEIKDYFTGKNKDLRKVIDKKYLYKIW